MLERLRSARLRASSREACALLLGAGVITALAFLTPPSVFDGQDWLQIHQPYRSYAARALAAGRLPLWNPHVALGRPFLADLETAVFYPPNLLFLLLDGAPALALLLAAHVALALVGSLRFARSLGASTAPATSAALGFTLGAPLATSVSSGQIGYSEGACYVPLLFLLTARLQDRPTWRRAGGLAAGLALQLLCGHPQIAWITWLGLGAFLVGRGSASRTVRPALVGLAGLTLALALALALAAPALLPFLELTGQGNRSEATLRFASGASMEWWQWASLVVPDAGRHVFYWAFDLYAGAFALVAGLAGLTRLRDPGVRGLACAGLLGALVAAGPRTPAFTLLFQVVPGLGRFHIHSRAALLPCLALVFAGAVFSSRPAGWRASRAALFAATIGAGTAFAWATAGLPPGPARPALVQGLLVMVAASLTGAALWARPAVSRLAATTLPVVVAADLLSAHYAARVAWPAPLPLFLESEQALSRALGRAGLLPAVSPPRVLLPPQVARENAAMAYGWCSVTGYSALTLDRTWRYLHDRLAVPLPVDENTYVSTAVYEREPFAYAEAALSVGWDPVRNAVAFRHHADPRAYLVSALVRVDDWREAAPMIAAGHDVHAAAIVEEDGLLPAPGAGPPLATQGAEITAFAPERVVVRSRSDRAALLVVKEAWYPGWSATVDGRPARCVPANGWMRAVPVGPGTHEVVLRYRSRWLGVGVLLSSAAALALVAALASATPANPAVGSATIQQ
jgi:hypothetical protein